MVRNMIKSIRRIVTKCPELVEISVQGTHLQEYAISSMCRHLPPKLQKLCLSNLNVTNEHVRNLTIKCPNLSELDLTGTQITYSAVPYITENLSQRSSSSHVFKNSETTNLRFFPQFLLISKPTSNADITGFFIKTK